MRNILMLLVVGLLLGCEPMGAGYGQNRGYGYDNHNGYSSSRNDGYHYGHYYPYGREDYPRDRIYIVERPSACSRGRVYQGYCYLHNDDYRRALEWDRKQGYDDHWHQQRNSWCNQHDCRKQERDQDQYSGHRDHHDHVDKKQDSRYQKSPYGQRYEPETTDERDNASKAREWLRSSGGYQHQERHQEKRQQEERQQEEGRWQENSREEVRQESQRRSYSNSVRQESEDGTQVSEGATAEPTERKQKMRLKRGGTEESQESQRRW
jgi:hypothetical protein